MNEYETKVYEQLQLWQREMTKRPSLVNRISKKAQNKVNQLIPEKVHLLLTESIKNMVKATLVGSNLTTKKRQQTFTLFERDELLKERLSAFRKTAVIEGAGTGAGGILLGFADFPLLLTIKMKFLFEAASIYGFNTNDYEERLFILHVFQLAFSSDEKKKETMQLIDQWEERKQELIDMDWREFQQEYRDYIDLVKMLQLIPGFGAVVGAYANYNLLDQLGETAMNAYRLRLLKTNPQGL
ncbi:EcsC family protein [Bacillus aquiflavi]|uniref:EcsC family protein n=1 Tax=Bacillus aquiflavi TaxID=2672567 RepID=A0A6B3VXJ0_9BACI|nr:EcsC family protein [Bacillus aquiflavi]MBA4535678.1 EcsC family protein [Bacillus aquiflavi]NEY80054.1 EcsC family protein [Bacillus aquiflavi]UAC48985.1 EcsC family protein [Bacillus aquiflavi]